MLWLQFLLNLLFYGASLIVLNLQFMTLYLSVFHMVTCSSIYLCKLCPIITFLSVLDDISVLVAACIDIYNSLKIK